MIIQQRKLKNQVEDCKWILNLLESKFFGTCNDHWNMRKNEKNVFCIDCIHCYCKHCVTGYKTSCRNHHRRLQICRYVYHDVVRLQDIQKYFDCSNIQTYKINGEKAVHLNHRPQQHKDSKQSKLKIYGTYCEACARHIQDIPNRFCSIACKVSVVMFEDLNKEHHSLVSYGFCKENYDFVGLTNENESSYSSSLDSVEDNNPRNPLLASSLKTRKSVAHKRKGVPKRAPFC
ncbi:hypothetical protein QVD17_20829 [Tagetes erecta]|uniref:PLATZ transcription factor family protein n=1 Tax=Tagetes erecta TaxID=13708 RepID=A0AAD8NYB6_TARER|nr:hypothetical protein QVD17_20829 [Tagetes erecta]